MPELLTERLRLRPLRVDDAERLLAIYSHPLAVPWTGAHTLSEIRAEIAFYAGFEAEHGWSMRGIELRATGELIGDCGIVPLELKGPELELMYDLHPGFWGRGLASEAVGAVLDAGFGETGAEQIIAVAKPTNAASLRILAKFAFAADGTMHAYDEDLLRFVRRAHA
jgi:ribosomal-protein-alanine N-acetyltransferase